MPFVWSSSVFDWARGREARIVRRDVHQRSLPFLVESTLEDRVHACTVDDVARVLRALPPEHVRTHRGVIGIQGIVLRQHTRKEELLRPVWGRMAYGVEVGENYGPVIVLGSQPVPLTMRWGRRLRPEDQRELDRLVEAGAETSFDGRDHSIHLDLNAIRRLQLYHTLLHEVGHWNDMCEKVEWPSVDADHDEWTRRWDAYFQRATLEREEYAHRYADRMRAELERAGAIPFARQLDAAALAAEGLSIADFVPGDSGA